MKDKIKIKVGSSLSAILQSTVNIPQAFTELVKNSMQNLATYVKIDFRDDKIYIEDDGCGFDDIEDSSGKNDFDKYFVLETLMILVAAMELDLVIWELVES